MGIRSDPGMGTLSSTIKSTPLEVNGVLYFTLPDHAWAVDAHTGRQLWHYQWESDRIQAWERSVPPSNPRPLKSTASSISRCPITPGLWMLTRAGSSGITNGNPIGSRHGNAQFHHQIHAP